MSIPPAVTALWVLSLALVPFAAGQRLIDPATIPEEWRDFQPPEDAPELACRITTLKPKLNYSFRFQTGFLVQSPLGQFAGKAKRLATFVRVTPQTGQKQPTYFLTLARIPDIADPGADIEIGGGFVVGEGRYRVDLILTDEAGRFCTRDWNITAKLGRKEDDVPPGMPSGAVDEISLRKWTRGNKGTRISESGSRLTILLNASPAAPRRTRLGGYDRVLLLSSLASMVERLPARAVRLVVFSPDQQREIFREDDFEPSDFGEVARALEQLELGTVHYDVLKNRRGQAELVGSLISEAVEEENQSDAVVFLGPKPWYFDRIERSLMPQPRQPRFFYVQLRPIFVGATQPDTLMNAVKRMGGKTFQVFTPADFAAAIRQILEALEAGR